MKKTLVILLTLSLCLSPIGCGGGQTSASAALPPSVGGEPTTVSTPAAAPTTAPTQAPTVEPAAKPTPEPAHPYAWLGLADMPSCTYLDLLASQHYMRVIDAYAGEYVAERTEAADGLTTYVKDDNLALNLAGKVYTFNDRQMIYLFYDMTELYQAGLVARAMHVEQGVNEYGRVFQATGKGSIPLYAEKSGDTAEYEYYEYLTDTSAEGFVNKLTERFYMKDGDVFAIHKLAVSGENQVALTEVVKSMTGEIPEGTFALPANFDEYKLYE